MCNKKTFSNVVHHQFWWFFALFDPFTFVEFSFFVWTSLWKPVITSLGGVFLYIFNGSNTCDNADFQFEINN